MKFNYIDLLNEGFKREDCNDSVFFDQYGFQYFIFTKKLNTNYYFDWDINTQKLSIVKHDYEHTILFKQEITSEEEYNFIYKLLKNENK
jgi:hypothetical protein